MRSIVTMVITALTMSCNSAEEQKPAPQLPSSSEEKAPSALSVSGVEAVKQSPVETIKAAHLMSLEQQPLEAFKRPKRFSESRLTEAASKLASKSITSKNGQEPVEWPATGKRILRESALGEFIEWYEAKAQIRAAKARGETPKLKPVRYHQRLLSRTPSAHLDTSGKLTVRFSTVRPVAQALFSVGEVLRADLIRHPRYRKSTNLLVQREKAGDSPYTYEMSYSLPKLHSWRYRTAGPQHDVAWRLDITDAKTSSIRAVEGRLAVRCTPGPCGSKDKSTGLATSYVRLPSVVMLPVVDLVTPTSAVVSFSTDVPTIATLMVSDGKEQTTIDVTESARRHEVLVDGLKADQRYRYAVVVSDSAGTTATWPGATFRTAPKSDTQRAVRLAIMSDSRSGTGPSEESYCNVNRKVLDGLISNAVRAGADAIVFIGDLVDGYTTEPGDLRFQLEAWAQVTSPYGAYLPIYEAMGNHEAVVTVDAQGRRSPASGKDSAEAVFAEAFVNPKNGPQHPDSTAPPLSENTYSFDYGNVHIAVVNSNYWVRSDPEDPTHPMGLKGHREGMLDPVILKWLDRDLSSARARGQRHLLVATHEPVFPNGGHAKDGMWWFGKVEKINKMREQFLSILSNHEVAAVLHGDEHNYSRLLIRKGDAPPFEPAENPIMQIITGGAGAPWYVQQMDLPWSNKVAAFDLRQHLVYLDAQGDSLIGTVQALTGETIETFELAAPKQ